MRRKDETYLFSLPQKKARLEKDWQRRRKKVIKKGHLQQRPQSEVSCCPLPSVSSAGRSLRFSSPTSALVASQPCKLLQSVISRRKRDKEMLGSGDEAEREVVVPFAVQRAFWGPGFSLSFAVFARTRSRTNDRLFNGGVKSHFFGRFRGSYRDRQR